MDKISPISINLDLTESFNSITLPISSKIGNTLGSVWNLTFGNLDYLSNKLDIIREKNISDFKSRIVNKVSSIDAEKLKEPNISILGPALEASKYRLDEPELRELFANLIAHDMDSSFESDIHVSFSEIIRQLSPYDAKMLKYLKNHRSGGPICRFSHAFTENSMKTVCPLAFLRDDQTETSIKPNAVSLTNLNRLGLIKLDFAHTRNDKQYEKYKTLSFNHPVTPSKVIFEKGILEITPLGHQFLSSVV